VQIRAVVQLGQDRAAGGHRERQRQRKLDLNRGDVDRADQGGQPERGLQHHEMVHRCKTAIRRQRTKLPPGSVSLITAMQAELSSLGSPRDAATLAFHTSMPLEDFLGLVLTAGPVHDLNVREVESGLREFLLREQTGVRRVARELFRVVSPNA
jgi:hypothetical protein